MSHRAALRVARAAARRRYLSHDKFMGILNHEAEMLACKGISALPSNVTSCGATRRTGGGTPPILAIRQVSWEYFTTKQKCVLAQTFLRDRQCRVRAAGTVGGKAPGGCKAASDEGNYTTKRKCLLARAFSRGRQCHIVRHSEPHGRRNAADTCHTTSIM